MAYTVCINTDPDGPHSENLMVTFEGAGAGVEEETRFYAMPAKKEIDLGAGCSFLLAEYEGHVPGGIWQHTRPSDGAPCGGAIRFKPYSFLLSEAGTDGWDLQASDPLTLSPSLLCRSCQRHGYIREGKWEEA